MLETIFLIYWMIGLWVYIETGRVENGILWPVWAWRKVMED
jgi:hypothetical protein